MDQKSDSALSALVKRSQPLSILAGLLFYSLGGGLAHYLGEPINWGSYWLGMSAVLLLQLSSSYLKAMYDMPILPVRRRGTPPTSENGELTRNNLLVIALTTLTIGAVLTVLLFAQHALNIPALIILGICFLLAFFYSVPPLRLVYSGYGELTQAFLMANLIPALAFLIQAGELHRLIMLLTFPLTALYWAMLLALSLENYLTDDQVGHRTLMIRLGWQHGMNLHNVLIFSTYILLGVAAILGLPWPLAWPGLLTLPLGLYQIWQIIQISQGAKPRWQLLALNALATTGLTAYLLAFALWTH